LSDASTTFARLRAEADPAEIALAVAAAAIAQRALAQVTGGEKLGEMMAAAEREARKLGAEEIYLAAAPDLARDCRFKRIEGDAPLGERFALRASVAYKGTWIRLSRTFETNGSASPNEPAAAQFAAAWAYFGWAALDAYLRTMLHISRMLPWFEPRPYYLQSLRGFWMMLLPWPHLVTVLYLICSIAIVAMTWAIWRSTLPLALRFSALLFATVLVSPHFTGYDLVILAPAILLTDDWVLANRNHPLSSAMAWAIYGAYVLPLLGPLTNFTHLQLSVLAFVAAEIVLLKIARRAAPVSMPASTLA